MKAMARRVRIDPCRMRITVRDFQRFRGAEAELLDVSALSVPQTPLLLRMLGVEKAFVRDSCSFVWKGLSRDEVVVNGAVEVGCRDPDGKLPYGSLLYPPKPDCGWEAVYPDVGKLLAIGEFLGVLKGGEGWLNAVPTAKAMIPVCEARSEEYGFRGCVRSSYDESVYGVIESEGCYVHVRQTACGYDKLLLRLPEGREVRVGNFLIRNDGPVLTVKAVSRRSGRTVVMRIYGGGGVRSVFEANSGQSKVYRVVDGNLALMVWDDNMVVTPHMRALLTLNLPALDYVAYWQHPFSVVSTRVSALNPSTFAVRSPWLSLEMPEGTWVTIASDRTLSYTFRGCCISTELAGAKVWLTVSVGTWGAPAPDLKPALLVQGYAPVERVGLEPSGTRILTLLSPLTRLSDIEVNELEGCLEVKTIVFNPTWIDDNAELRVAGKIIEAEYVSPSGIAVRLTPSYDRVLLAVPAYSAGIVRMRIVKSPYAITGLRASLR